MGRVWVVGSLNVDRGWRVERHPALGETVFGAVQAPAPGGKGLNQAVAAARMGAAVCLVGCVGDDEDGRWLRGLAAAEGIDTSPVAVAAGAATGTALIVVDGAGANTVTVDPGANGSLRISHLGIAQGDVVVAQLEVPAVAVVAAFAEARAAGATTILNPSPLGTGRALVADVDVVVVNESEATELGGPGPATDQATRICGPGQTVVVTRGADGVAAAHKRSDGELFAPPMQRPGLDVVAVDTTGAGDCFLGVLAAAMAGDELNPQEAIDLANRAAARSVTRPGTVDAMPRAAELA